MSGDDSPRTQEPDYLATFMATFDRKTNGGLSRQETVEAVRKAFIKKILQPLLAQAMDNSVDRALQVPLAQLLELAFNKMVFMRERLPGHDWSVRDSSDRSYQELFGLLNQITNMAKLLNRSQRKANACAAPAPKRYMAAEERWEALGWGRN